MELQNLINYYLRCVEEIDFIEDDDKLVMKHNYCHKIPSDDWIERYKKFVNICESNGGLFDTELNTGFKRTLGLSKKIHLSDSLYNELTYEYPDAYIGTDKNGYYITFETLRDIDFDSKMYTNLYDAIFGIYKDEECEDDIFDKAFKLVNNKYPGIYKKGKINGNYLTLLRIKSSECPLSCKKHDKDNAYLLITETSVSHAVSIGCNRGCTISKYNTKLKKIGTIKK